MQRTWTKTKALMASAAVILMVMIGCQPAGEPVSPAMEAPLSAVEQNAAQVEAGPDSATAETSQTSAAILNSSPPVEMVKLIFIHHSTGENWLADDDGGLGISLRDNNYFVSDTNYGWGPDGIGDRTDILNWMEWFRGPNSGTYLEALYSEFGDHSNRYSRGVDPDLARENEIILFKSCFPNSNLDGSPDDPPAPGEDLTVGNAKYIYTQLLEYFATRPDKLFVVITAPPVTRADSSTSPANARAFNNWLVNEWLADYSLTNVAVFDFYNVLTSNGGSADSNDLNQENGNHHRWWNGEIQHIRTANNDLAAYPSGDSHPSQAGNQKATAEFVPLLNAFYHRWRGEPIAAALPDEAAPEAVENNPPQPSGASEMDQSSLAIPVEAVILANDLAPNVNLGAADHFEVFFGDEEYRRSLLYCDLSSLPQPDSIDSAQLEMYRYDGDAPNPMQAAVYLMTSAWVEGSGAEFWPEESAIPDGATWGESAPGIPWLTTGGDFDTTHDYGNGSNGIVAQIAFPAGMANGWASLDVTGAVRAWLEEGAPNYGLLLRPLDGQYTYHYFYSDDAVDPSLQPRLVVRYH